MSLNPISWFRSPGSKPGKRSSGSDAQLVQADGEWDITGGSVLAKVERIEPKSFNGTRLQGSIQNGTSFNIRSKEDLLQQVASGWGGGAYKAYLKTGSGDNRGYLGVVKFSLPGDPLDGDGLEYGAKDAHERKPNRHDRVEEALTDVELTKARAEKIRIEREAGIDDEGSMPPASSEISELRDMVSSLADGIASRAEDDREKRRLESDERRHREMMEIVAALKGGGGDQQIEAMKMIVQSQADSSKAVLDAQARTQELIEANRRDTMKRSDDLMLAMRTQAENSTRMILEVAEKGAAGKDDLMKMLIQEKGNQGKSQIEFFKEAMQAAREMTNPVDAPTSTADVIQSIADRGLGVVEAFVGAKRAQESDPRALESAIRGAARDVVDEEAYMRRLPAPVAGNVDASVRRAFDAVLNVLIEDLESGSNEKRWIPLAAATLPPPVIAEVMAARNSGDSKSLIAVMRKYGSASMVDKVLVAATAKGRPEEPGPDAEVPDGIAGDGGDPGVDDDVPTDEVDKPESMEVPEPQLKIVPRATVRAGRALPPIPRSRPISKVKTPKVETPEVETPEVETPEVDVGLEPTVTELTEAAAEPKASAGRRRRKAKKKTPKTDE